MTKYIVKSLWKIHRNGCVHIIDEHKKREICLYAHTFARFERADFGEKYSQATGFFVILIIQTISRLSEICTHTHISTWIDYVYTHAHPNRAVHCVQLVFYQVDYAAWFYHKIDPFNVQHNYVKLYFWFYYGPVNVVVVAAQCSFTQRNYSIKSS